MQDIVRHTKYLEDMSEKSGISYNTLKTLWVYAEKTFNMLDTFNPDTYKNLKSQGSESEAISEIFDDLVAKMPNGEKVDPYKKEEESEAEEEFGEELDSALTGDENAVEMLPEELETEFGDDEPSEDSFGFEEEVTEEIPEEESEGDAGSIKSKIANAEKESGEGTSEESSENDTEIDKIFSDGGNINRTPEKR